MTVQLYKDLAASPSADRDSDCSNALATGEDEWPASDVFTDETFGHLQETETPPQEQLHDGQIQLVRIRPGSSESTICCETRVCNLSDSPEYTAISYAWGSPIRNHHVQVNGKTHLLPTNLWRFLTQARELPRQLSGWIWVDALSIDQSNLQERADQVKIMSTIFGSAQRVVIWLGPAYHSQDIRAMKALAMSEVSKLASPIGSALLDICDRPYWRRLWVLQELRHAKHKQMMCGKSIVEWSSFERLILNKGLVTDMPRLEDRMVALRHSAAAKMLKLAQADLSVPLWSLLETTEHLRCAEPRDKVFAILSVSKTGQEDIVADYTTPLPQLLNAILRNYHKQYPPEDLSKVEAQCTHLEDLFGVPAGLIFTFAGPRHPNCVTPLEPQTRMSYRLGPPQCPISLWWVAYYHHRDVRDLFDGIWNVEFMEEVAAEPGASVEDLETAASVLDECCIYIGGKHQLLPWIVHGRLAALELFMTSKRHYPRPVRPHGMVGCAIFYDRAKILSFLLSQPRFPRLESYECPDLVCAATWTAREACVRTLLYSEHVLPFREEILASHRVLNDLALGTEAWNAEAWRAVQDVFMQWAAQVPWQHDILQRRICVIRAREAGRKIRERRPPFR